MSNLFVYVVSYPGMHPFNNLTPILSILYGWLPSLKYPCTFSPSVHVSERIFRLCSRMCVDKHMREYSRTLYFAFLFKHKPREVWSKNFPNRVRDFGLFKFTNVRRILYMPKRELKNSPLLPKLLIYFFGIFNHVQLSLIYGYFIGGRAVTRQAFTFCKRRIKIAFSSTSNFLNN